MRYPKEQLVDYLRTVANSYGIDPDIAYRQINAESGFRDDAVSPAGAKGIAQFVDGTAKRFGLDDPFDPVASLNAWGAYMSFLLERFGYRYDLALAGYNSGENRSEYENAYNENRGINWSVLPGNVPIETRSYVRKILGESDRPIMPPAMSEANKVKWRLIRSIPMKTIKAKIRRLANFSGSWRSAESDFCFL